MSKLNNINIDELKETPLKELLAFQKLLIVAIENRKEREKKEVMQKIQDLVSDSGFSMEDVLTNKPKKKAMVKYKNSENDQETWTGRGRKPKWLQEQLDKGVDIESFKI